MMQLSDLIALGEWSGKEKGLIFASVFGCFYGIGLSDIRYTLINLIFC